MMMVNVVLMMSRRNRSSKRQESLESTVKKSFIVSIGVEVYVSFLKFLLFDEMHCIAVLEEK